MTLKLKKETPESLLFIKSEVARSDRIMNRSLSREKDISQLFHQEARLARYLHRISKVNNENAWLEYANYIFYGFTRDRARIPINEKQINEILKFTNDIIPKRWNVFCDPKDIKTEIGSFNIRLLLTRYEDVSEDMKKLAGWSNQAVIYYRGVGHTSIFLSLPLSNLREVLIHELAHAAEIRCWSFQDKIYTSRFCFCSYFWASILPHNKNYFSRFQRILRLRAKGRRLFLSKYGRHPMASSKGKV
jgi:hypothetical protein